MNVPQDERRLLNRIVDPRNDPQRLGIRNPEHVALVDRLEAAHRRAVESDTAGERVALAELLRRNRKTLQDPPQIGEKTVHPPHCAPLQLLPRSLHRRAAPHVPTRRHSLCHAYLLRSSRIHLSGNPKSEAPIGRPHSAAPPHMRANMQGRWMYVKRDI